MLQRKEKPTSIYGIKHRKTLDPNYLPFRQRTTQAITFVEVLVTIAVVAVFMASLFAMNSQMMLLIRSAKNQNAAVRSLKERTEQFRIAGWSTVTSPIPLQKLVEQPTQPELSGWTKSVEQAVETVAVTELDSATLEDRNANIVVRKQEGVTEVSSTGPLENADLIRADFEMAWKEGARAVAPRRMAAMLSPAGMMSSSLGKHPYVGVEVYTRDASGAASPPVSAPPPSPAPPVQSTPTPTPTPTPMPVPEAEPHFCKHGRPWPHCGIR